MVELGRAALPPMSLLQAQADWLAPARSRLLRRVGVAHRRRVLDLGAGYGLLTGELERRSGGLAVALDPVWAALQQRPTAVPAVVGQAQTLPFAAQSFDLLFCQAVWLWLADLETAVAEAYRVLQPGGVLLAIEPDYGGLIEYPPAVATRELWLAVLSRLGARPFAGRQLPHLLAGRGFAVQLHLLDEILPPSPLRLQFLHTLPLTAVEKAQLQQIETAVGQQNGPWQQMAHLPYFLITATK